jgi:broad specificity phosphatase PhoE
LSQVYLVRHGQAGLRHDYDILSDLGRRQAALLGDYLVAQRVGFKAIYAGALARQQQTAEAVRLAYVRAGLAAPEILTEPLWNEFDLDQVYRDFAPLLSETDPQFCSDYEDMRRLALDLASPIHRTWSPCDTAVVRAWTEGRHACSGESWVEFQARIRRAVGTLAGYASGEPVAVFTSATPIAITIGAALGSANGRVMRLAAVMYNSAVSTMRLKDGDLTLYTFNGTAHLPPDLRTFR